MAVYGGMYSCVGVCDGVGLQRQWLSHTYVILRYYVRLDLHTYVMLRYCTFSWTSTYTSCYAMFSWTSTHALSQILNEAGVAFLHDDQGNERNHDDDDDDDDDGVDVDDDDYGDDEVDATL